MFLLFFSLGCNNKKIVDTSEVVVEDSASPQDTALPVAEDESEIDKTGQAFCSAGGFVQGEGISGSFCFGAVDIAAAPISSGVYTWQPGPFTRVSP